MLFTADKILVEKVIRALLLLEGLAETKLPFIFKGGTALMLMQDSARRLSIDIDIIIPEKPGGELDSYFDILAGRKEFIRWELQERKTSYQIAKAHYKFYYTPVYQTALTEDYVLLDVLFDLNQYKKITSIPVQSHFLVAEGTPLTVSVPSIEDILGDKLTAFAPYTTGIPYRKGGASRTMEIIKQLYDIGHLFDIAQDFTTISETFRRFAVAELGYRSLGENWNDVLEDIHQTALLICTRGQYGKGAFNELMQGIKHIKQYIYSESWHIDKAIVHAAKAAYLARLIQMERKTLEKFTQSAEVRDWIIEQPFNTKLNKLKKSSPEAFFYWYKIYKTTQ